MSRPRVRFATTKDLDLLVRHRRSMWEAIRKFPTRELDGSDAVYRRWARARMKSNRFAGFILEVDAVPVASGCVWLVPMQPRPGQRGTIAAYLLSMFTEPGYRGRGHATRIVREAIRWARSRGASVVTLHLPRPANRSIGDSGSGGPARCAATSRGRRGPAPILRGNGVGLA